MIGAVFYQLLALTNPRPHLEITPGTVRLGQELVLTWKFSGKVRRFRKLSIKVMAEETATYRRGTNTYTDEETFFEYSLLETEDYNEMLTGEQKVAFPINTVPTFEADNNEVNWYIVVEGDIPRWPDVEERFDLVVLPTFVAGENS